MEIRNQECCVTSVTNETVWTNWIDGMKWLVSILRTKGTIETLNTEVLDGVLFFHSSQLLQYV